MKSAFAVVVAAAFGSALFAASLGHFKGEIGSLHGRLDRSDCDLAAARTELAALRARPEPADELAPMLEDVLASSVQVSVAGAVGGGTVLLSRPDHTYVITAFHVVHKARPAGSAAEEPIEVRTFDPRGAPAETSDAELVAHDEQLDLALLRVRSARAHPHPARLAPRERVRSIRIFDPIAAMGCPLGHDPLPTMGEIATLRKEVNGERFWMMTAPTIFGNSGGGVYHRKTRELIGVSVMVCTYDGVVSTPVPHLGILVPLDRVYDWLDAAGFRDLGDPGIEVQYPQAARVP